MRAVVTICETYSQTFKLDISLATSVNYWWDQEQNSKTIEVTPMIPIYLAIWLKECMEEKLLRMDQKKLSLSVLQELTILWMDQSISKLNEDWKNRFLPKLEKWKQTSKQIVNSYWEKEWLREDAQRILPCVEGRRWLFEQVEKRVTMLGLSILGVEKGGHRLRDYLPIVLQALYLQGEIEITSGITIHPHRGEMKMRCERCGNEDYGIHLHFCTFCEDNTPVCDTCYVMGKSNGCTLVISKSRVERFVNESMVQMNWSGEL